jgi:predicted alpha/beta-fold hydrolase
MNPFSFPPFRPLRWLRGGHIQTLAGYFLPGTQEPYTAHRHVLTLPDGDRIVLHEDCPASWRSGGPTALLLHGICGDHRASYVARAAGKLNRRGVRTFRIDQRCCGASWGLAKRPYHGGSSEDTAEALRWIGRRCPASPTWVVGYSAGGNIALKLAGEDPNAVPENLRGVVAVNPPIDLAAAMASLRRSLNRLYDMAFRPFLRHMVFPLREAQLRFRTLHEFNERILARVWGFGSAARYYARCSAIQFLSAIRLPALVIASADDPLVPISSFEHAEFSPSTQAILTEHGGHLGFIGKSELAHPDGRWMDWRVVDWVTRAQAA